MIGVFDSGIGGLTVLRALRKALPEYSFVYFGDTARAPYGNKSPEAVLRYGREDANLLLEQGAKLIVIACNTVSALAAENLKKEIGVPVFEVISPAAEEAVKISKSGRVGVIGTRATIGSGAYQKLLEGSPAIKEVCARDCPLFVPLVEEGWEESDEALEIAKKSLNPLKLMGIDTLILGCTHYPLLRGCISKVLGEGTQLIDSAEAVTGEVVSFLRANRAVDQAMQKDGTVRLLASDRTQHFDDLAKLWLGDIKIEQVST